MSSVAAIEQAITQLSPNDFGELERWFLDEINRKWDRQFEVDASSGSLDFLIDEAKEDIAAGRTKPADEVFNDPTV